MTKSTDQTSRLGVQAVGLIFEQLGWAFREQPTSDYGIDAQAEKRDSKGEGMGKLIGLQIKSGASWFKKRGDDYVYYGEDRHKDYWLNHSLPVFIVIHDPDTGLTLWQKVERHLVEEQSEGRWSITIPSKNTLDSDTENYIAEAVASDLPSVRRYQLVLDMPIIQMMAEHDTAYLHIDDWVNKGLNYRNAALVLDEDPDAEPAMTFSRWLPGYTLDYYMARAFPWMDWQEHEYLDESHGSYEVATHILEVSLSNAAKAMLSLEEYYARPLPPFKPEPVEIINPLGAEEAREYYESLHAQKGGG